MSLPAPRDGTTAVSVSVSDEPPTHPLTPSIAADVAILTDLLDAITRIEYPSHTAVLEVALARATHMAARHAIPEAEAAASPMAFIVHVLETLRDRLPPSF